MTALPNDGVIRGDQPGRGGDNQLVQAPSNFSKFRNVHADQYPYNAHSMLAMFMRMLLGISANGLIDPREELQINGLKANPRLTPDLLSDPDISPLAVRPRNVTQPRTSY